MGLMRLKACLFVSLLLALFTCCTQDSTEDGLISQRQELESKLMYLRTNYGRKCDFILVITLLMTMVKELASQLL